MPAVSDCTAEGTFTAALVVILGRVPTSSGEEPHTSVVFEADLLQLSAELLSLLASMLLCAAKPSCILEVVDGVGLWPCSQGG